MISDLNSPSKTDPQSYSPTFADPLDETLDLSLPPVKFYKAPLNLQDDPSDLIKKPITVQSTVDAFPVSSYIKIHFRKEDLPPLHKDPDFEDEVYFFSRDSERSYPIEKPFKGIGIRPSTECTTLILLEAEERLQRISTGTLLSGTIDSLAYKTIQTKLNTLKALLVTCLRRHRENPNLNRHKVAQDGNKFLEQTKELQSFIQKKSRDNEELKDLNHELEKLKTLCFYPLSLR